MQESNEVAISSAAPARDVDKGKDTVERSPRGFFADQFENTANFDAHFEGTGPEIWRQTNGNVDAFVSGAGPFVIYISGALVLTVCVALGTGGTISGCGKYLKSVDPNVRVVLADPEGSGLYNKIKYGVMYDPKESEGTKRRHQVSEASVLRYAVH